MYPVPQPMEHHHRMLLAFEPLSQFHMMSTTSHIGNSATKAAMKV